MTNSNLNQSQIISQAYTMYAEEVKSLFWQYNISMEDTEDLLQELFIKLLGIDMIRPETIKSLIMVAAYNMRKDYFRKKTFRNKALASIHIDDMPTTTTYGEDIVVADDIKNLELKIVSNTLNPINKKVYSLSRFEEKTSAEIADEMGLGLRSVESRLYYIRKIMRKKLACAL